MQVDPCPVERRMFLLGTGFVARRLSGHLLQQGWHVSGSCTSSPQLDHLRSLGIHQPHLFHAQHHRLTDNEELQSSLQLATHVLVSIPPLGPLGDPLLGLHKHDLQRCFIHSPNLQWLSYLSSTSVYGDCAGAWVHEDSLVNPLTESAILRYQAENAWSHFGLSLGLSTFIFRLGGIYGPGRSALDTLIKRRDLSENQKRRHSRHFYHTARIHVDDICQTIFSSIANPHIGKIYNVVDDDPAPRAEVFAFARDLLSQKYPEMASVLNHVNIGDVQRIVGEKLVTNMRMKKELSVKLIHPSYKSGLQSILDSWPSTL